MCGENNNGRLRAAGRLQSESSRIRNVFFCYGTKLIIPKLKKGLLNL
jgi:hypothetical protein